MNIVIWHWRRSNAISTWWEDADQQHWSVSTVPKRSEEMITRHMSAVSVRWISIGDNTRHRKRTTISKANHNKQRSRSNPSQINRSKQNNNNKSKQTGKVGRTRSKEPSSRRVDKRRKLSCKFWNRRYWRGITASSSRPTRTRLRSCKSFKSSRKSSS